MVFLIKTLKIELSGWGTVLKTWVQIPNAHINAEYGDAHMQPQECGAEVRRSQLAQMNRQAPGLLRSSVLKTMLQSNAERYPTSPFGKL